MRPDRMMWGIGLILAGTAFAGLLLNLATGLTPLSWAVAFAVAAVAAAGAGRLVMRREPGLVKSALVRLRGFRPSRVTGGLLLLAAVLAGAAVWLANASAGWPRSPGFAQLWLTPATRVTSTLAVRDNFPGQQTFRLVLRGGGGQVLGAWDLSLTQGESWQRTVARPTGRKLTARLGLPGQTLTVTS
jgi:hypothetical protein